MHNARLVMKIGAFILGLATAQAQVPLLPTLQESSCPEELEARIKREHERLGENNRNRGLVVVGRVVLDGPGDPRDVMAQMQILSDGYFATGTEDTTRSIGFRLHQYAPLNVDPKGSPGETIDVGTIHLKPLAPEQLQEIKGHIELEGRNDASVAVVELSIQADPVNALNNGIDCRPHWAPPIRLPATPDGNVQGSGLSPIKYYCSIHAPGYVEKSFSITLKPGEVGDIGTIRLERPRKLALRYVVADKPPFDAQSMKVTELSGGDEWKATHDIYGFDIKFVQQDGQIQFKYFYTPCNIKDLGQGKVEDFIATASTESIGEDDYETMVKDGHVYLINQAHWQRWILFDVSVHYE